MGKNTDTFEFIALLNAKQFITAEGQVNEMIKETKHHLQDLRAEYNKLSEEVKDMADGADKDAKLVNIGNISQQIEHITNRVDMLKAMAKGTATSIDFLSRAMSDMSKHGTSAWSNLVSGIRQAKNELQNFSRPEYKNSNGITQEQLSNFIAKAKAHMAEISAGYTDVVKSAKEDSTKTIEEAERMLAALSEVRKVANGTEELQEVDSAINKITNDMERLKANSSDVQRALNAINEEKQVTNNLAFKGSINDLERMKASLLAYQKTINTSTKEGVDKFNRVSVAIRTIDNNIKQAGIDADRFGQIIKYPKDASLHELEKVVGVLQSQFRNLKEGTTEYYETLNKLRAAKKQINELTSAMNQHETSIEKARRRLQTYVAVYVSFNQAVALLKKTYHSTLELSDALSDIQKRTRLSDAAIKDISKTIDGIDTRTSQRQLHELAATAGLLGLKSKEDVVGFTKAANQMSVALVELGSEGAAQLMKISTLTGDVAKYGTEQALVKTGSAINELTASSAASAGPIVDFISRMGAVGSQAKLTMGDLAGIGATLDALGQPIELSATAMNRFIMAIKGNTGGLATALGMDAEQLYNLMEAGRTMDAILLVLEKMAQTDGGVSGLSAVFDEMGSEGVRLKQTISSLIGNVDFMRTQVALSNKAFDEGVSVMNEYNIKNENAAAIMERTGNMIAKQFTNSDTVDFWKSIAIAINKTVEAIIRFGTHIRFALSAFMGIKLAALAATFEMKNFHASFAATAIGKNILALGTIVRGFFIMVRSGARGATAGLLEMGVGLSVIKNSLRSLALTNPFGLFITAVTTLVTFLFPELVSWLSDSSKEMENLESVSARLAEQTAKYNDAGYEEKILFDTMIDSLNRLKEGTREYEAQKQRIIEKFSEERTALIDNIKSLELTSEQLAHFCNDLKSTNDEQYKLIMSLSACTKGYENMQQELAKASLSEEEYASKQKALIRQQEELDAIRKQATAALQPFIDKEIEALNALQGECDWQRLLRDEIEKTAKARMRESAVTEEMNKLNETRTTFRKNFISNAVKNIPEDVAVELVTQLLDMGSKASKEDISGAIESAVKNYVEDVVVKTNFGDTSTNDRTKLVNNLTELTQNTFRLIQQQEKNIKTYSTWVQRHVKTTDENGGIAPINMKSGWNESDSNYYGKDNRERINQRSSMLHTEWSKYGNGDDMAVFNAYVGKSFKDYDEARKWVETTVKGMQNLAKQRGWNLEGGWAWNKGSKNTKSEKQVTNDMMRGMIDDLDRYYTDRETRIKEARLREEMTEEEMNREIEKNQLEHYNTRAELYDEFLDKDATGFKHLSETMWKDSLHYSEENLNTIRKKIRDNFDKFGATTLSDIAKKRAEDLLKVATQQQKKQEELAKAILDSKPFVKALQDFRKNMDSIDLFGTQDEETALKREKLLFEHMKEAYAMDTNKFRSFLENNSMQDWLNVLDDDKIQIILQKWNAFSDTYEDLIRKSAQKWKKNFDAANSELFEQQKRKSELSDGDLDTRKMIEGWGFAGERLNGQTAVDDAEVEMLKTKIELTNEYIRALQEKYKEDVAAAENSLRGAELEQQKAALQEMYLQSVSEKTKELMELQAEQSQQQLEMATTFIEQLKPYADSMIEFGENFGSAIFGNKEERQEAARDLLRSVIKVTGQMLQQWLIYISTKRIYDNIELLQEKAKNAKMLAEKIGFMEGMTAAEVAQKLTELKIEKAESIAEIIMNGQTGVSKEVAKRGLIGLAIGAAITAAMAGLMALVNSSIGKATSEISSAKAGKLKTGMLTYADGNYPVLGVDGKTYNAKYEGRPKTGVYSGGARFGIFSEKKPEAIIDGDTTQKILLNYPGIWQSILTIQKHGRLKEAYQTYAQGNIQAFEMPDIPDAENATKKNDATTNQELMASLANVIQTLNVQLANGIGVNMRGDNGLNNSLAKYERFKKRNHVED